MGQSELGEKRVQRAMGRNLLVFKFFSRLWISEIKHQRIPLVPSFHALVSCFGNDVDIIPTIISWRDRRVVGLNACHTVM